MIVADVTDKGVPAALVMATTRTLLRAAAERLHANAGHDMPYLRRAVGRVEELRARGMPLGLLPGMSYEEKEVVLQPGDTLLLYSDGLVEAHNPEGEMLGFQRVRGLIEQHSGGAALIPHLLAQLAAFTGPGWEQEIAIHRCADADQNGRRRHCWRCANHRQLWRAVGAPDCRWRRQPLSSPPPASRPACVRRRR